MPQLVTCLIIIWLPQWGAEKIYPAPCNSSLPVRELSSSSTYQEAVAARYGRLDNEAMGGAWCPKGLVGADQQEFLQLDLGEAEEDGEEFVLKALVVQGRWANGLGQEFAEQVMLHYWRSDLHAFVPYVSARGATVLEANRDTHSKVLIRLEERLVVTSKVRVIPVSPHPRTVCLRAGLLGCPATGRSTFNLLSYSSNRNFFRLSRS
jgi:hypothetical protein